MDVVELDDMTLIDIPGKEIGHGQLKKLALKWCQDIFVDRGYSKEKVAVTQEYPIRLPMRTLEVDVAIVNVNTSSSYPSLHPIGIEIGTLSGNPRISILQYYFKEVYWIPYTGLLIPITERICSILDKRGYERCYAGYKEEFNDLRKELSELKHKNEKLELSILTNPTTTHPPKNTEVKAPFHWTPWAPSKVADNLENKYYEKIIKLLTQEVSTYEEKIKQLTQEVSTRNISIELLVQTLSGNEQKIKSYDEFFTELDEPTIEALTHKFESTKDQKIKELTYELYGDNPDPNYDELKKSSVDRISIGKTRHDLWFRVPDGNGLHKIRWPAVKAILENGDTLMKEIGTKFFTEHEG